MYTYFNYFTYTTSGSALMGFCGNSGWDDDVEPGSWSRAG